MLDINNLTVTYNARKCAVTAVRDVSCQVGHGVFAGLVGESGSGKSTLLMSILGLLPKSAAVTGEIIFDGVNLIGLSESDMRRLRWKKISLIPQSAQNSFTPVLTIGRHISEVLDVHLKISGLTAEKKIDQLLEEVDLDAVIKKRYPHELSGGEKQRAAIAVALACSPKLLLADEPTTALDVITQAGILELLARLRCNTGFSIMLITHDLPLAATVCEDLMVMYQGCIVERGTPRAIIDDPRHKHARDLVNSSL